MKNSHDAAEQLREEMRQLRSHMDADVDSFVENTRGLLDWHSYFQRRLGSVWGRRLWRVTCWSPQRFAGSPSISKNWPSWPSIAKSS